MLEQNFFELIQVALGRRQQLSATLSATDWERVYIMAQKQALVGICFIGVKKLWDSGIVMPQQLYYQWLAMTAQIQDRNNLLNNYVPKVTEMFRKEGFPCYILKGQSIGKLYGDLSPYRQSGDIDVWTAGGRQRICQLSIDMFSKVEGLTYHHIHFPYLKDVEIEAHFIPGYLNSPGHNMRLMKLFLVYEPKADEPSDDAPIAFNQIYILLHCYMHFLERGMGLRQLMDYYFVLQNKEHHGLSSDDLTCWLKRTGMMRFARAAVWVLINVFGMEEQLAICKPDEKEGRFLLKEMLQTGNFGHHDNRYNWNISSPLKRFLANQAWNIHLLTHYPKEIFWSPIAALYRYLSIAKWRKTIVANSQWDELQKTNTEL